MQVFWRATLGVMLALGLLAGPGPSAAAAAASAALSVAGPVTIHPDPSVRRGVLPNGMRYAILQQANPKGAVSIRFGFDVGSYEEQDEERGAAHFLEHMAFNGSRNFAEGKLDDTFALIGVAGGRDINAHTGMFSTRYELDLTQPTSKNLDLGFLWLRDVADGMILAKDAVDRERGVVLAERETRNSPTTIAQQAVIAFRGPELRSTQRDPIGTIETVTAMTAERLRGFYQRWYRPQNAVLVVVGDLPADEMERRVKSAFESWTSTGPPLPHAPLAKPNANRGLDVLVRQEPNLPTAISACRVRAPDAEAPGDFPRQRRRILGRVWRLILQRRLSALQATASPPYLGAVVTADDEARDASLTCLVAIPIGSAWEPALKAAQGEMQRFAAQGPTELETERAVEEIRSEMRGQIGAAPTRSSTRAADWILDTDLSGETYASSREQLRIFDIAVDDLSPRDVQTAFARDWSGAGPFLTLMAPTAIPPDALKAAWAGGDTATKPDAYVDQVQGHWAYADFGPSGHVVGRELKSDGAFVRVTLQNGVIVNFKHTDFFKESVSVRVRFGAGRREIPNDSYFTANLGAVLFKQGGLGRHSAAELESMFRNTGWDARLSIADDAFNLDGIATQSGLRLELELLAAFVTDPGFRPQLDAILPTGLATSLRLYGTSPAFVASQAMIKTLAPNASATLPPLDRLLALRSADFERLLKPAITKDPLEVTIVGDVDEKSAIQSVIQTFGALPARRPAPPARSDTWFMRYPDGPVAVIKAEHDGPADKAMVGLFWPLYVATPARRREEMALTLVAGLLDNALKARIREELGKSYAPSASTSMPDNADQGELTALVETYPQDIDLVVREVRLAVDRLASGQITPAGLEAVRKPILTGIDQQMSTNSIWIAGMSGSSSDSHRLDDVMAVRGILATLTVAEVRKAAAVWLKRPPIVVIATPKAKGTGK